MYKILLQPVLYRRRSLEKYEFEDRQKNNNSCTFWANSACYKNFAACARNNEFQFEYFFTDKKVVS